MNKLSRQEIFEQAAKKLRQDFEALAVIPHRGAKGGEAERLVREFLNRHLPGRFKAGAGFVIDKIGNVSRQLDVVIYDAMNCPVYRWSEEAAIFPADNVAAVIEVKSSLDKDRLHEGVINIEDAKSLGKTPAPEDSPVQIQTLGFLFAFESAITLQKVEEHFREEIRTRGIGRHIDLIAVLDRGLITWNAKIPGTGGGWAPALIHGPGGVEGSHLALGISETGYDTLDAMLRLLLAHLSMFRGMMDHPGFNWRETRSSGQVRLSYLMSITFEADPKKRDEILRRYREDVIKEFAVMGKGP